MPEAYASVLTPRGEMRSGRAMHTQQGQRGFAPDVLQTLNQTQEVQIEPRSPDGRPGQPVTIWVVVTDGDVFVRSYKGSQGHWYQAMLDHPEGALHVGNREIPFRATRVSDPATIALVSQAYRAKYEQSWPTETAEMLRAEVLPMTLKLEPLAG
jgi:hypothetical protein